VGGGGAGVACGAAVVVGAVFDAAGVAVDAAGDTVEAMICDMGGVLAATESSTGEAGIVVTTGDKAGEGGCAGTGRACWWR
jgi:DNA-binding beta-propeller fold protein YncE